MKANGIKYRSISIDNINIFYREAGSPDQPHLLLLHGYPSSSHMFRNIMENLAGEFHLIAPDLPGFGFSDVPTGGSFDYTFEGFSRLISSFLAQLQISRLSYYLFDYGAPILMRIIEANISSVEMLIFQNGNIHMEGLGEGLKLSAARFANKTAENLTHLQKLVEREYIRWEYLNGSGGTESIAPEAYALDEMLMQRPGLKDIHLAIKEDYKTNLPLYKQWQQTLYTNNLPILIVWGENDEVFRAEGAQILHRENPGSRLVFYPTGHFALEEFSKEIGSEIISYYRANFKI